MTHTAQGKYNTEQNLQIISDVLFQTFDDRTLFIYLILDKDFGHFHSMKHSLSNFTPTKHELDWNIIAYSAPSRLYRYTDKTHKFFQAVTYLKQRFNYSSLRKGN